MAATARDWTPVQQGKFYCSPACGGWKAGLCTVAAYERAHADARRLARRLGKGWTVRVHENLGWHWNVISPCGRLSVYTATGGYLCFIHEKGDTGSQYPGRGTSPETAIADSVSQVRAVERRLRKLTEGL